MNQCQVLRALLKSELPLVMPDAYDALSARLIENAGYKAVQCSGYSMALSAGCKTEDDLSLERNLQITQEIIVPSVFRSWPTEKTASGAVSDDD